MRKNGFTPILIIVFIALIAGAGGFLVYQKQTKPSPSPTPPSQQINQPSPTSDPTTNWETYINTKYEYSIKYPTDWNIEPSGSQDNVIFLPINYDKTDKPPEVSIHLMNQANATAEDLVYGQFDYKTVNHNGITFLIGATTYTVGGPTSQKVQDQAKSTLNKMYSTFKFLSQNQTTDTTNWKTYTNTAAKISIKYPPYWEIAYEESKTDADGRSVFVGFGQPGLKNYEGQPFGIVDLNIKQDLKNLVSANNLEKIPQVKEMDIVIGGSFGIDKYVHLSDIVIDGVKGKKLDHLYCQSGSCHDVVFKKDDLVYGLTMNQGGEKDLDIFSQMVSTIKFTQ